MQAAIDAVAEVGNPTVIATLTVVAALLPMLFVSGLMGPYMAPIPAVASAAMLFSFVVAMVIAPWLMLKLAPRAVGGGTRHGEGRLGRLYRRVAAPLLASRTRAWVFLLGVGFATLAACALFYTQDVTVKLLPFDNKSELQVVLNLPAGASLEDTEQALFAAADIAFTLPEVRSVQAQAGTAAPFNFNGLVRHSYLRSLPEQGDLQINLAPRSERSRPSHAIALDLRKRLRAPEAAGGHHAAGGRSAARPAGARHVAGGSVWPRCGNTARGGRGTENDLPRGAVHRRCGRQLRQAASAPAHRHRPGRDRAFPRRAERRV